MLLLVTLWGPPSRKLAHFLLLCCSTIPARQRNDICLWRFAIGSIVDPGSMMAGMLAILCLCLYFCMCYTHVRTYARTHTHARTHTESERVNRREKTRIVRQTVKLCLLIRFNGKCNNSHAP